MNESDENKNRTRFRAGDALRSRASKNTDDDIFKMWEQQKKFQKEDKELKKKYEESKRQAKLLKKTLRKNQYGEAKHSIADASEKLVKKVQKQQLDKKLKNVLNTAQKSKLIKKFSIIKLSYIEKFATKKNILSCLLVSALLVAILIVFKSGESSNTVLGDRSVNNGVTNQSGTSQSAPSAPQLPIIEKNSNLPFELLFQPELDQASTEIVLVSPEDNSQAYAYLDMYSGANIRITQQELPDEFKENQDLKLAEIAGEFQATNVIQLDEIKIYHGLSNTRGEVQSLIFIKKDRLVFIAADKKLDDALWVGYISSLK